MQLTRAADYGVRVMIHMAGLDTGARVRLAGLAHAADASPAFLSKVMQQLVRAGLVSSHRGKCGGFSLLKRETSLLEIISALNGVPPLNDCLRTDDPCRRRAWCGAHVVWLEAQRQLCAVLASATLDSLARTTVPR